MESSKQEECLPSWQGIRIKVYRASAKNFLFAGSNEGGKRLALFYSLLASCKKQQVNPWKYLKDILERLPTARRPKVSSSFFCRIDGSQQ